MELPKRIDPNPIYEAVVEIRFDTEFPSDAVFGIAYSILRDSYPEVEKQPILQLPEIFRNQDPNFTFQSHYKLRKEKFVVQIGPRMFSVSMTPNYTNWTEYRTEILSVFNRLAEHGIVSNVSRFGLRYIDYFNHEILNRLDVKLKIMGRSFDSDEVYVRTIFKMGDFNVLLQIVNASEALKKSGVSEVERRSAIDTDVSIEQTGIPFFDKMETILEDAHACQKEIFFSLLSKDFLESMNPEY